MHVWLDEIVCFGFQFSSDLWIMTHYCGVPKCKRNTTYKYTSFHRVPQNPSPEWVAVLKPNFTKSTRVCNLHFSKESFKKGKWKNNGIGRGPSLKRGAVPSLYPDVPKKRGRLKGTVRYFKWPSFYKERHARFSTVLCKPLSGLQWGYSEHRTLRASVHSRSFLALNFPLYK